MKPINIKKSNEKYILKRMYKKYSQNIIHDFQSGDRIRLVKVKKTFEISM